jgi:hypothetical protein
MPNKKKTGGSLSAAQIAAMLTTALTVYVATNKGGRMKKGRKKPKAKKPKKKTRTRKR